MSESVCHVCGSDRLEALFTTPLVPINPHRRWASRTEAVRAERDGIDVRWCGSCGALVNAGFDSARVVYDATYDNALSHSPGQQAYVTELAQELVALPGVAGGSVLEIGCGDGAMLRALVELGAATALGIDPAARATVHPAVRVLQRQAVATDATNADLLILRHVLEHVHDPEQWLAAITARMRTGAHVYVEVPSGSRMLERTGVWDLLYEHATVFTPTALARVLSRCGLSGEATPRFGGQYLSVSARAAGASTQALSEPPEHERTLARSFGREAPAAIDTWRERVRALAGPVALWGAGTKGVVFLNFVDPLAEQIGVVVDTNPRKQGAHVAGTGHSIVGPGALTQHTPETVVLMNPMYEAEVRDELGGLGLNPELVVVG